MPSSSPSSPRSPRHSVLVVATGATERMHSRRPQPLHLLCGRPMVQYVVDAVRGLDPQRIVVVAGDGADQVEKRLAETVADPRLVVAEQRSARGSAESVLLGLEVFADDFGEDDLLIVPGNMPLLRADTVEALLGAHQESGRAITVLGVDEPAAENTGRLIPGREPGSVDRVASSDESVVEPWLNATGVMAVRRSLLAPAIRRARPDAASGRVELHSVVEVLTGAGHQAAAVELGDVSEARPVLDRVQLASAEAAIRRRTNEHWMRRGVTMLDPDRTYVDTTVRLAPDVTLFPGTMLQGSTVVGAGAEIGPDTRLDDCAVGASARVEKTMGREAEIGEGAQVGPFAVLDPGSHVAAGVATGPFHHARSSEPTSHARP
ncbi:MAG: NTP transferase domain-containing protein [Actinomycetota bacterium]